LSVSVGETNLPVPWDIFFSTNYSNYYSL